MSDAERNLGAEKAADFIRDNAAKYAKAKAQATFLQHHRKTIRGQLIKEYSKQGITGAEMLKAHAEADERYETLLKGWREAIEIYEELNKLMGAAELKVEIFRTISSTERAEMNLR